MLDAFLLTPAATIALSNAVNATIIKGGTATLGTTVSNSAGSGANNLSYAMATAVQGGSATLGSPTPGSGSLAPSASQACTVSATSNNLGINTVSLAASDPNSTNGSQSITANLTVLDHSNASLSATANQTTQTINFGNVLRRATVASQSFTIYDRAANTSAAYTANMKLTGFTATGDSALNTSLATFNNLVAGTGNTYAASLNTSNYTTTGTTTITMSASRLADDSTLSGAGGNNNGGLTLVLEGNVGNATADNSNSTSVFGSALTAQVAKGGSYANLESTVTATSGSGGTGMLGSTATILDGTASAATTVSMAWRTRTTAETTKDGGGLLSDVVSLSGIAPNGTGSHDGFFQTDTYVLQMSYDPSELVRILGITESQAVAEGDLCLKSLNNGLIGIANNPWGCAVDENFGGTPNYVGDHAYNSSYFVLGDYGVDTTDHVVWAVVDYSGTFAAPEPGTFALLAAGALSLLAYAWRRHAKAS